MTRNPYEVLGISKDASEAVIKSSYRKLAKKYHPDLHPDDKTADAKFKELNAANDLLTNTEKRGSFDRGEINEDGQPQYHQGSQQKSYRDYAQGPQGNRYNFSGGEFDMSDFEGLFGGLGGRNRTAGFNRPPPQQDIHYTIEIDFLEAALGAKKSVTMPDGKSIQITIPEGIEEGQKMRLKGQGVKPSGDAYVEVHIKPHAFYTRNGKDINIELPVALQETVHGLKIQVPTIHGPVTMTVPKGAASGKILRLKSKGIKGGDQYTKLKIVMPEVIDPDLEQAIQKWSETHAYNPRKKMEATS